MRVALAVLVIGLAGCGRVGFDPRASDGPAWDAALDAPTACSAPGPWGAAAQVANLGSVQDLSLSPDRLELYGARFGTAYDLVGATRSSAATAFPVPQDLGLSAAGDDVDPAITGDGLELFYISERDTPGTRRLYVTRRANRDATFPPGSLVPELGESLYDVAISPDGLSLYSNYSVGFGVATRPTRMDRFGLPTAIAGVPDNYPTISSDELELYVNTATHVARYTRGSKTASFQVDASFTIPGVTDARDPFLTQDGRELWFWRSADGEVYRTVRTCP